LTGIRGVRKGFGEAQPFPHKLPDLNIEEEI